MRTLKSLTLTFALLLSIFAATGAASAASPFKKISGGLLHVSSGVIFPARVGVFRFEQTKIYGSAGRDVGAEYDVLPLLRGDVYVYPLGSYAKDFNGEARVQLHSGDMLIIQPGTNGSVHKFDIKKTMGSALLITEFGELPKWALDDIQAAIDGQAGGNPPPQGGKDPTGSGAISQKTAASPSPGSRQFPPPPGSPPPGLRSRHGRP